MVISCDGICLSSQNGLLCIEEEILESLIKKEPISNVYEVEPTPFARGKFGVVSKAKHKMSGLEYAVKSIRKRWRVQREEIIHEVAVLCMANHTHRIVDIVDVYETNTEIAIVLELAGGGELQSMVDIQDGLEEAEAVQVMRQVMEAVVFLHDNNIAHLDLKPQNMLLSGEYPGNDLDLKLCDFGISRVIKEGVEIRELLGTPDYVAPEVLSYEPISLATDIWSVGVLTYVLLCGCSPFAGDTKQETFCNISQCSLNFPDCLFEDVSSLAKDFISTCLVVDPRCRPNARACLNHPWLGGCGRIERPIGSIHCLQRLCLYQSESSCPSENTRDTSIVC